MAPPSCPSESQQCYAEATAALSKALQEFGDGTEFAASLRQLVEASAKLDEFDQLARKAGQDKPLGAEAQQWQDISMVAMQYCRESLAKQRTSALDQIIDLTSRGASLCQAPQPPQAPQGEAAQAPEAALATLAVGAWSTPGSSAVPPGLAAPAAKPPWAQPPPPRAPQRGKEAAAGQAAGRQPPWAQKPPRRVPDPHASSDARPDVGFFDDPSFWGGSR